MYELPRARRIRRRSEFVRIQNAPSARVPTHHLLLLLRPRDTAGPARLGVVASKKVGNSVVRNRAKRLVREAFRKNPDAFPDNLDVVIIVRPGAHLLPAGELSAQVQRAKAALHRRAAELAARAPNDPHAPR
ncbi:MAG: ribonuclease P protein component [Byssovorax sp.]